MRSQERGVALALVGKGDNILCQESLSRPASSATLRILQTSSSATDIAWMSLGPNTLSLWNGTMVHGPPLASKQERPRALRLRPPIL